jgi:predicted enzyme related to lactoylglutathione lyase
VPETAANLHRQLLGVQPYFLAPDIVGTAEYYRDTLGFHFDGYWGEPPSFVMVERDGVAIMLRAGGERGRRLSNRATHSEAWDVYVWVRDLESLHGELKAAGAKILAGPVERAYHCRELEVEDCNGYVICFGQDVS